MSDSLEKRWLQVSAVVFVAACALGLRMGLLDADPPHGLSVSLAPYTDEGLKYYQARNRALFGQWHVETPYAIQGHLRESPVPSVIGAGVFGVFGVGRVQARMISVVAGSLSCMLLALIAYRRDRAAVGVLAGVIAATNFIVFSYDRLGLFEPLTVLLSLSAVFFYLEGGWRRFVLAPVFLVLAYFTRITAVVAAAALAVSLSVELWGSVRLTRRSRRLICAGAAGLLVLIAAALFVVFPDNQVASQVRERVNPLGLDAPALAGEAVERAFRTLSDSVLARWMPVTLVLALLGSVGVTGRGGGRLRRDDVVFLLWFLFAFGMVAFVDYRPTRYYILMIVPGCYLAAGWIVRFASGYRWGVVEGRFSYAYRVLAFFAAVQIGAVALRFAVARRHDLNMFHEWSSSELAGLRDFIETWFIGTKRVLGPAAGVGEGALGPMALRVGCLSALAVGMLLTWYGVRWIFTRFLSGGARERVRLVAAVLAAVVVIVGQGSMVFSSFSRANRRREVAAAERKIVELVGERSDACIGGNWATTLCMGTGYFTFPFAAANGRPNGNAWDTFKRFPVTHMLVKEDAPDEEGFLLRTYAREMERSKRLAVFEIDNYRIVLYEYEPAEGAARPAWPFEKRSAE